MVGWKQNDKSSKKEELQKKQFLFFIYSCNNYFSGAAASTGFFLGRPLFGFSAGTSAASFFGVSSGSCSFTFLGRPLFGFSAGTSSAASFFTLLDLAGFSVVFAASVSSSVSDGLSLAFLPHP